LIPSLVKFLETKASKLKKIIDEPFSRCRERLPKSIVVEDVYMVRWNTKGCNIQHVDIK
jgi:hypothetical protein